MRGPSNTRIKQLYIDHHDALQKVDADYCRELLQVDSGSIASATIDTKTKIASVCQAEVGKFSTRLLCVVPILCETHCNS